MLIPAEPIGSIPRPPELIEGIRECNAGHISREMLNSLYDRAIRDTIQSFEATRSPVIIDGEVQMVLQYEGNGHNVSTKLQGA